IDHLSGDAILDDLRGRSAAERQYRGAARHGFDHHESKRLRPVYWEQKSGRLAEECCFLALVDLADELYARTIEERAYLGTEVVFIYLVDLGGDLQRDAGGPRNSGGGGRAVFS